MILLVFSAAALVAGLAFRSWLPGAARRRAGSHHAQAVATRPRAPCRRVESGSAVWIRRRSPGWAMVEAPAPQRGWLADEAVAAVGG